MKKDVNEEGFFKQVEGMSTDYAIIFYIDENGIGKVAVERDKYKEVKEKTESLPEFIRWCC